LANLHLTLLQQIGAGRESFSDSQGVVSELTAKG
jgi:hypothetical protein